MAEDVLSTYVYRATEVGKTGFNSQLLMDLLFQGISMQWRWFIIKLDTFRGFTDFNY